MSYRLLLFSYFVCSFISLCNSDASNLLTILDPIGPIISLFQSRNEVCYDRLGCFNNEGPFRNPYLRPINTLPQSPHFVGTKFLLYTRENNENEQILEANHQSISQSNFNPNRLTKIFVHGYKARSYFGVYQKV